jgi:uncharacterized protein YbaP (TraB family)
MHKKCIFIFNSKPAMKTLLTFFMLWPLLCNAQITRLEDKAPTVFWGVVNAHNDTSYIFGTFNELGNGCFNDNAKVWAAYNKSRLLLIEYSRIFVVPNMEADWLKYLTTAQYKLLRNEDKQWEHTTRKIKYRHLMGYPPFSVAFSIISDIQRNEETTGLNISKSQRRVFEDSAHTHGKEVWTLGYTGMPDSTETHDTTGTARVCSLLDLLIDKTHYNAVLKNLGDDANNYRLLTIDYKFSESYDTSENSVPLIDNPGSRWMRKVRKAIDSNSTFITVGYKHLQYKSGMLVQLENNGYTVFPIAM